MENKSFQDINGKPSSKRIAGFIGLIMAIGVTVTGLVMQDPNIQLLTAWLGFAGAALLGTILERPGQ